jgi:hypothetical protein
LRELVEDLARRYVIFNRVDLNLVLRSDLIDPERFDDALAPLLPRARRALGQEISRAEVERFWNSLEREIMRAAAGLGSIFSGYRDSAGRAAAEALLKARTHTPELAAPHPISTLRIRNFRSIGEAEVELAPITILHGPNGGGKSSVLEALELTWAGTSQRRPPDVPPEEYERHLPRNGVGDFEISADGGSDVTGVTAEPRAELARCVLTHEAVASLVSQSPDERYASLVTIAGLEVPDLARRTTALVEEAKRAADSALRKAALPTLPRRDTRSENHLRAALQSSFSSHLPAAHDVVGAEAALAAASQGSYRPRQWPTDQHAASALIQADAIVSALLGASPDLDGVGPALDEGRGSAPSSCTAVSRSD